MTVSEAPVQPATKRVSLPVASESMRRTLDDERDRLLREAGIGFRPPTHFKRPVERPFTRRDRDHVTVLLGGLTMRHEELILAGLRGLGYKMARLPVPAKADFQAGKEYGNNGQCNPTYFTVGNLVNFLKDLRDRQGMPTQQIIQDYVFITAGSCGPCRFGMYEAEYRLALRNAGFDGFRVMLFDQTGGANQAAEGAGIEFNISFFLALLNALYIGDLLNEVAYHIRPYEVVPGSTNAALAECMRLCQEALEKRNYGGIRGGRLARFISGRLPLSGPDDLTIILDQIWGKHYVKALRKCAEVLNRQVEVDYTRAKPIVKVTGEFWAQTTEGDGNFRMFSFLEGEGAQVLVEPVATWVGYLFFVMVQDYHDRQGLRVDERRPGRWDLKRRVRLTAKFQRTMFLLRFADRMLRREFERLRRALGGTAHRLVDQKKLRELASPYYNSRAQGGEGHMEVAKNIYYATHQLSHMVMSLKPFGCMPSTQSDGAQAAVIAHYPDMIFLPIETSGEGDINAYSRAQMALGEAKAKSKGEFTEVIARSGYSLAQIQQYVAQHPELRRPIQPLRRREGVVGQAANFVLQVSGRMKAEGIGK